MRTVVRALARPVLPLFAFAFALSTAAIAQPAFRVADVNPATPQIDGILYLFQESVSLGGRLFFQADDGQHGIELWATDGTAAGTAMVADVCPGACASLPRALTVAGGLLFFVADDGAHGHELWRTDGTATGTSMVADVRPGLGDGAGFQLAAAGGFVFFPGDDGAHGYELWKSDGNAAGTALVADLRPGPVGSDPAPRAAVLAGGGKVLLNADDGVHGREPWVSDGTGAGTVPLGDLQPGAGSSCFGGPLTTNGRDWLGLADGRFLFTASDGTTGFELWTTDGTAAGTVLLDINPGPNGSQPQSLVELAGTVYLAADDGTHGYELWQTDGTVAGTALVKNIRPDGEATPGSGPFEITVVGSRLVFRAFEETHGVELWTSDGTEAGTTLVKDIQPGTTSSMLPGASYFLTDVSGTLFFFADDGVHGLEPWKSDGTAAGTTLVVDLAPGSSSFGYTGLGALGGAFHFRALGLEGIAVWRSDGTAAGTVVTRQLPAATSSVLGPALPWPIQAGTWSATPATAATASAVLFPATDGTSGLEPWTSNGTAAGTIRLADAVPGPDSSFPGGWTALGAVTLFSAGDGLWRTDGTAAGTSLLATASPTDLAGFAGLVFFNGEDANGRELWRSDGTAAGTFRLADINPGADSSQPTDLTRSGASLFFAAQRPAEGNELWKTDGTAAGTALVADIRPGAAGSFPAWLTEAGGRLFFAAETDAAGREPWTSDGTAAGTVQVKDIRPGAESSIPSAPLGERLFATAASRLFFVADDGTSGEELWVSDGTDAGTHLVKDVFPGARGAEPRWLTAMGNRVFFVADDGVHGRELWGSDGTEAGTTLAADLLPGGGSSEPTELAAIGTVLLFAATDGAHGVEPWVTDGTAAGTRLVQDIAPGAGSSSPAAFTPAGARVFFAANDGTSGFEPWALPRIALGASLSFYTVPPCRVFDTRGGAPLVSEGLRTFAIAGACGIPATAQAITANLTVVGGTGTGHLTVLPAGAAPTGTSTMNFQAHQVRANNAILTLSPTGLDVRAVVTGGGSVHLLLDVTGYFE